MSHEPTHSYWSMTMHQMLKLLGLRLTSEGFSVVTAESGAEGFGY